MKYRYHKGLRILVEAPMNYHHQNPYYRQTAGVCDYKTCTDFTTAMAESYRNLNARYWLPETSAVIRIGSVKEAEYEKQLVRISQSFIPSQGPPAGMTLCQVFADERLVEIMDGGGIQYRLNLRDTD